MDNNNFLRSLSKGLLDDVRKVMEATKTHTVPKSEKEKKLAALAEPKDKITHKDVLVGRGVAKEEFEQIDEALDAAARYGQHHAAVKELMKSISQHIDNHKSDALKHRDYRGKKGVNWGHVGDIAHIHSQLADIHDRLAQQGEYKKEMAESVEDDVTLSESEIAALQHIVESMEDLEELSVEKLKAYRSKARDDAYDADDVDDERRFRKRAAGSNMAGKKIVRKGGILKTEEAELEEARRGRPPKNATAAQDEEPAALGYQLRKAASINRPVHFMNGEKKEVAPGHIEKFNDHMAARKSSQEKAAFQNLAHKSHADFVKAVSSPIPKSGKDTGEIVKYRH